MFSWNYDKTFNFYLADEISGRLTPVSEWQETGANFIAHISVLQELVDNGFADFIENSCIVEPEKYLPAY